MADENSDASSTGRSTGIPAGGGTFALAVAGAVAAGTGLFLWNRGRTAAGEESTADEIEAHPS